ncbi:hypothetical protein, partial [Paracidovorax avenae]|uniref:hypothetical protein n=1 Tax=Paracidovorax avenae TaxID=80867 RepID=UPI001CEF7432
MDTTTDRSAIAAIAAIAQPHRFPRLHCGMLRTKRNPAMKNIATHLTHAQAPVLCATGATGATGATR